MPARTPATPLDGPHGLVLDGSGNIYFAATNHNQVRRLVPQAATDEADVEAPRLSAVNAANLLPGRVAPGELIPIQGLGPEAGVAGAAGALGLFPQLLGGTQVLFDGLPGSLLYSQSSQVNAQVPYTVAPGNNVNVEVRYNGQPAGSLPLTIVEAAPRHISRCGKPGWLDQLAKPSGSTQLRHCAVRDRIGNDQRAEYFGAASRRALRTAPAASRG